MCRLDVGSEPVHAEGWKGAEGNGRNRGIRGDIGELREQKGTRREGGLVEKLGENTPKRLVRCASVNACWPRR